MKVTFTKNGKKRLDEVSAPIERPIIQRPKGQAIFVRQIYSFKKFTIARLIALGLSFLLLPSIALAEPDTEKPYLLPEIIIQSLRGDPTVGRSAALSCQAIFSLGQRRAERKVQLSATIDGERELRAERDELIRNFNSDSNRLLNEIEKRTSEMLIINERLDDLTTRYETLIAIPDPVFATTGVAPDIVPGMQVTVDIIGGKRTVMDYILSPIQRATEVAFREK